VSRGSAVAEFGLPVTGDGASPSLTLAGTDGRYSALSACEPLSRAGPSLPLQVLR